MIDLASIDTVKGANEGFDVTIYHPGTHEDLDIVIRVLGKDSDEFNKITRAQNKKRIAKMSKSGFRAGSIPPEEFERDGIELLAACTVSWKQKAGPEKDAGFKDTITIDGEEVKCSKESAAELYERFPWIKEQIDAAIGDRANFIKA